MPIGRSPRETIVEFSEIESIVIGLPDQQSRFMRLGRFSHDSEPSYRRLAAVHRDTILLRLQNGYDVAWYISRAFITNADSLKTTLLQMNRSKGVGPESDTPREIRSLGNVYFNKVRLMSPGRRYGVPSVPHQRNGDRNSGVRASVRASSRRRLARRLAFPRRFRANRVRALRRCQGPCISTLILHGWSH
ncbi:MAG: hypothetical protein ACLQGP_39535 [Isosphaeraceae bacterium]